MLLCKMQQNIVQGNVVCSRQARKPAKPPKYMCAKCFESLSMRLWGSYTARKRRSSALMILAVRKRAPAVHFIGCIIGKDNDGCERRETWKRIGCAVAYRQELPRVAKRVAMTAKSSAVKPRLGKSNCPTAAVSVGTPFSGPYSTPCQQ